MLFNRKIQLFSLRLLPAYFVTPLLLHKHKRNKTIWLICKNNYFTGNIQNHTKMWICFSNTNIIQYDYYQSCSQNQPNSFGKYIRAQKMHIRCYIIYNQTKIDQHFFITSVHKSRILVRTLDDNIVQTKMIRKRRTHL